MSTRACGEKTDNKPENRNEMLEEGINLCPPEISRLVIRTIFKLENGGYEEFVKLPNGKKRGFENVFAIATSTILGSLNLV